MRSLTAALVLLLFSCRARAQGRPLPIIDMHLHVSAADAQGPPRAPVVSTP